METPRSNPELFENKFLNKLAHSDVRIALGGYPLVGVALWSYGLYSTAIAWYWLMLVTAAGYFGWTLMEYLLHRYLYHRIERIPGMQRFQYIFHGIHHDQPDREDKLLLPPAPWLAMLSLFFALFYLAAGVYAFGIVPGLVFGYVSYAYIHYSIHRPDTPAWMRNHRIHHKLHHHRHPDKAFGVTTPLWDRVFGTMPPERIGWNA